VERGVDCVIFDGGTTGSRDVGTSFPDEIRFCSGISTARIFRKNCGADTRTDSRERRDTGTVTRTICTCC
jgi:hypothetical protein